jgi:hypothetical protein
MDELNVYPIPYCECKDCDYCAPSTTFEDDPVSGHTFCPSCGSEDTAFAFERKAEWVQVGVYALGRAYGGPEGGGWYYTTGTLIPETVRSFADCDFPQIDVYVELMRRRYHDCEVRTHVERTAPESFPSRRPVYC